MMLGLTFTTPALLIGTVAALIPVALHLLSSARAREVPFPTVRFLQRSMRRTARRRRIRNWLLLLLRAALLGFLAFAVAEPKSRARAGAPTGPRPYAAVLILDNSFSMAARLDAARPDSASLFDRARAAAGELLRSDAPPAQAALLTTCDPPGADAAPPQRLRRQVEELEVTLAGMDAPSGGPDRLRARLRDAAELLSRADHEDRIVYLFTDAQDTSYNGLARMPALEAAGAQLAMIRPFNTPPPNAAVTDLAASGAAVPGRPLEISATVRNFSPSPVRLTAELWIDGASQPTGRRTVLLPAAGDEAARQDVKFACMPETVGPLTGRVRIAPAGTETLDALPLDDELAFSVEIRDRARVVVVHGPSGRTDPPQNAPSAILRSALDPFVGSDRPWAVSLLPGEGIDAAAFEPRHLAGMDAAFFADVPSFTPEQAGAVADFVKRGGRAAFFLGPRVDVANYNALLGPEGADVLPGVIQPAAGAVGPSGTGRLSRRSNGTHPLLRGLYDDASRYPRVEVMRHYPVELRKPEADVALRHAAARAGDGDDPLIVTCPAGRGHVLLSAIPATRVWSNLPARHIFLPMVVHLAIGRGIESLSIGLYETGAAAVLPVPSATERVTLTPPEGRAVPAELQDGRAVFGETWRLGRYEWAATTEDGDRVAGGAFHVHLPARESDLRSAPEEDLAAALAAAGIRAAHVGAALPDWPSGQTDAAPPPPRLWWDLVLMGVILLLVTESIVANRRRSAAPRPTA